MSHVRQQIGEAVQAALLSDSSLYTATAGRVHLERPFADSVFPCIGIYLGAEAVEPFQGDGITTGSLTAYNRFAEVSIEIKAEKTVAQSVDDRCNDIIASVERALADTNLGGLVEELLLIRIDPPRLEASAKPLMVVRMVLRTWYRTTAADPSTAI